jgi:DnaK suppressor protein
MLFNHLEYNKATIERRMRQMEKAKLEEFKARLLDEKARLLSQLEKLDQDVKEDSRDQYLEGTLESDSASDLYDEEQSISEEEIPRLTLAEVEKALKRIDEGTYGLSEVSGKPIPLEQLEALPWATRLVGEEDAN